MKDLNKINVGKHNLKYGLILGGLGTIFNLMLFFVDAHVSKDSTIQTVVGILISVGVIVYALIDFKKKGDGFITLGQSLKIGLGVSIVSAIIAIIYTLLLVNVLDTEFVEKQLELVKQAMLEKNPTMSIEQVEKALKMQRKFMSPMMISIFIIIMSLFFGFIISLITGLIIKKKPEME